MESERLSPAVGLLYAISPDPNRPDKERLAYPRLERAARDTQPLEEVLLSTYRDAEDESAAQLAAAVKLAEYELIETAVALQHAQSPDRQMALSRQFTVASIDIFGSPDKTAATYLLEQLMTELCVLQTDYSVDRPLLDTLLAEYGNILLRSNAPHQYVLPYDEAETQRAAQRLGIFLRQRYQDALAVFEGDPLQLIDASGIVERFEAALLALHESDAFWRTWRVLVTDDSCLSVDPQARRIVVGSHRAHVPLGELLGLFGHEVLVHALRTSNGQHVSHEFELGLPGYIAAEEGLGCFVEQALSGRPPLKMYDRYLDVALALGTIDGQPRTRRELFELVHARAVVRAQAAHRVVRGSALEYESWAHVNRIFRGTLGNDIVGVFTKDIAYYHGYQKIASFVVEEHEAGTSSQDLWELLTVGKFDPTDIMHVLELMRKGEE